MLTVAGSRGRRGGAYHLLTPTNRYPSRLAGWQHTTVFKLATPRVGSARFGQYLLEVQPAGGTDGVVDHDFEHFVLALSGTASLDGGPFPVGAYAYRPHGQGLDLAANASADAEPATVMWIKRRYEPAWNLAAPEGFTGQLEAVEVTTTPSGVRRRELLPADDPAFDFNVSLLSFPPGADLGIVEVHDEEHGLYMTEGYGTYHLDGDNLEVSAGDFIYMAPYCPQFFRPHGPGPAAYLLYKDVFRDGF